MLGNVTRQIGTGAALGIPTGAGLLYLKQLIDDPRVLDLPEEEFEMPLATGTPQKTNTKTERVNLAVPGKDAIARIIGKKTTTTATSKSDSDKKKVEKTSSSASVFNPSLLHLLGAGAGIGAGFKGTEYALDYMRRNKLTDALEARKEELKRLMLEEQELASQGGMGKKSSAGSTVFTKPLRQVVHETLDTYRQLPDLEQLLFGGAGLVSLGTGAREAYIRAKASDPERARYKKLKATLAERTGDRGAAGIKLAPTRQALEPLRPGAKSIVDPAAGRDALAFM
jgi:hypothetical protein